MIFGVQRRHVRRVSAEGRQKGMNYSLSPALCTPPDTDTALSCLPCLPSVADTVIYNSRDHPPTHTCVSRFFFFFFFHQEISTFLPSVGGWEKISPLRVSTDGLNVFNRGIARMIVQFIENSFEFRSIVSQFFKNVN